MTKVQKNIVESNVKLPVEVDADARRASATFGVSFDDFVAEAVLEKLATLEQQTYFASRIARAKPGRGMDLLQRAGTPGNGGPDDELK